MNERIENETQTLVYSHDATLKCNGNIPIGIFVECFIFLHSNDRFRKRKLNDN